MGTGNNLVLFDPKAARIESVELVKVEDLTYIIKPYSAYER